MDGCESYGAFMSRCFEDEKHELLAIVHRHKKLLRAIRKAVKAYSAYIGDDISHEMHTILLAALKEDRKLQKGGNQ